VLHKKCRSASFFCASSTDVCFGRNWHVPIYSARKTLTHLGKKILFTDIDRKEWQSTSDRKHDWSRCKKDASQDDADRTFPNRHHGNFVQALKWKLNSRNRSWNSPDWYFSADIAQFFFTKHSLVDNVFFMAEEVFLFLCCIKNVGRLSFFVRAQPTFVSAETGMFPFIQPGKH